MSSSSPVEWNTVIVAFLLSSSWRKPPRGKADFKARGGQIQDRGTPPKPSRDESRGGAGVATEGKAGREASDVSFRRSLAPRKGFQARRTLVRETHIEVLLKFT